MRNIAIGLAALEVAASSFFGAEVARAQDVSIDVITECKDGHPQLRFRSVNAPKHAAAIEITEFSTGAQSEILYDELVINNDGQWSYAPVELPPLQLNDGRYGIAVREVASIDYLNGTHVPGPVKYVTDVYPRSCNGIDHAPGNLA